MARARNIKPGLFTNDALAENNSPLGRLLFVGLWCLADYKGELEWRASRIKIQILPYDDCDITELAINLDKSGFVTFYSDGDKTYLKINNFDKHQNPHPNEKRKGSDVPAFTEAMRQVIEFKGVTINHDKSRLVSDESISDPADSLIPHPDSLILNPSAPQEKPAKPRGKNYPEWFESLWESYPPRAGSNDKSKAYQAANARIKEGKTIDDLVAAVGRYYRFIHATGKQNTEYVKQAASFFGPGEHIDNEWRIPGEAVKPTPGKLSFSPEDYSRGINDDGSF